MRKPISMKIGLVVTLAAVMLSGPVFAATLVFESQTTYGTVGDEFGTGVTVADDAVFI